MKIIRPSILHRFCLILVCLLAASFLASCGKKSSPVPNDARDSFTWTQSSVVASSNGCLTGTGILSGNVANLTDVIFELQPIQPDDACENCPFTPSERVEFSQSVLRGHPEVNTIRFTYCPRDTAPVYRWRFVGTNIHRRLSYAVTPLQTLSLNDEPESEHAPFFLP